MVCKDHSTEETSYAGSLPILTAAAIGIVASYGLANAQTTNVTPKPAMAKSDASTQQPLAKSMKATKVQKAKTTKVQKAKKAKKAKMQVTTR